MAEPAEDADLETSSEGYARRFAGPVGRFFLDLQARATLDLLAPWPRATVLDLGGGHGQVTGPLVEAGYEVTVYGSSPACGERIRSWTDAGRVRFQSGELLKTPFPDRAFDVVVSYRLLPHVTRWPELIAELARLARHTVVVDYPTSRSVNAAARVFFGMKKGIEGDTRPFAVFRDADVERPFARAGFRRSARRPQFFFPMALHRALGLAPLARGLETFAAAFRLTHAFGSPVIARFEREG